MMISTIQMSIFSLYFSLILMISYFLALNPSVDKVLRLC